MNVLNSKWGNHYPHYCPCKCHMDPYKVGFYTIMIGTRTMAGYGDPEVKSLSVYCDRCGNHEKFDVYDGSVVSDYERLAD